MSINLNITIDGDENITINGVPIASKLYVDNEISKINLISDVQDSVFQSYNGVYATNMFPELLNGTYIQLIEQRKLVATSSSIRFFQDNIHDVYYREVGDFYFVMAYIEPASDSILNGINLQNPAWLVLKYNTNPANISSNIDHSGLIDADNPLLGFISYDTSKFGSQSFPNNPNIEFF